MSNFKANNDMSAFEMFMHRSVYSGYAFSKSGEANIDPESTKNFWFLENMLHGRIREKSGQILIIIPKKDFLINCKRSTGSQPVLAIDFVVDAYNNLLSQYDKNRIGFKKISTDSTYLSKLSAHAGATNGFKGHDKVRRELRSRFISYSDFFKEDANNIFSFEDFVPFFMEFLLTFLSAYSITFSSHAISKHSTPMTSGLCIECASLKHSKDEEKSKYFLGDENFEIYKILASNNGFAIDKNAPWRLIADISSPQMLEFAANRVPEISSADDVLDYYFEDIRDVVDELEDFKQTFVSMYNSFIASRPTVSIKGINSDSEISNEIRKRTGESFSSVVSRVGNSFWYEKFLTVKNMELSLGYSYLEIKKMANNASDLESSLDRSRATGYIKKRMTPIISSEGSLAYRTNKINGDTVKESPKKEAESLARSINKKTY